MTKQNQPYKPVPLPVKIEAWGNLIYVLGEANRELARYDGLLQSILNPLILLTPLRAQEAVLSSRIEGTQATLEDVLEFEEEKKETPENSDDIYEVINYQRALIFAVGEMKSRPISLNMIRRMHTILLDGVRGENKARGEFRKIQNWIGSPGSTIQTARFVPPSPPVMVGALDNWEKYLHTDDIDHLIQLAIIHAQFEIIHPFLDGNGRIGRILIPLFLYHKQVIHQPVFYLSAYLEKNRADYYDALKSITATGDWTIWIHFFLKGIVEQAKQNNHKTKAILDLYEEIKRRVVEESNSKFVVQAIDMLFVSPIFTSPQFLRKTKIPKASANRMLDTLVQADIIKLRRKGQGRTPSQYRFQQLLDIINAQ